MLDLKTLTHKSLVDVKMSQLSICLRNNQKERSPKELVPAFDEFVERFGLFFAGDKLVILKELKK